MSTVATDIKDRAPHDFLWQRTPFRLTTQNPEARLVFNGTDYLLAYWLGRYHKFITDDAPNTCTRWAP